MRWKLLEYYNCDWCSTNNVVVGFMLAQVHVLWIDEADEASEGCEGGKMRYISESGIR